MLTNLEHISFSGVHPRSAQPAAASLSAKAEFRRSGPLLHRENPPDEDIDPLMHWLLLRAGLQPSAYRASAMQRRVNACLRHLRVTSPGAARERLENNPALLASALNTVLIGVSDFFRDQPVFACLQNEVLPELRRTRPTLRIASVGASHGQEIYSVAMILSELGLLDEAELSATDCRPGAVQRGRESVYNADEVASVSPARLARFFEPSGAHWALRPDLRHRVAWRVDDLLSGAPNPPVDLMLFRNVAIYFNEAPCLTAWTRICDRITPGGFLITGKAEKPPAWMPFTRLIPSVYRRKLS